MKLAELDNYFKRVFYEKEISISELFQVLWRKRLIVIICSILSLILGVFVAFTAPKEYTATSIVLTEDSEAPTVSSGFADALGLEQGMASLSVGSNIFGPGFYPSILNSRKFLLSLMKEEFYVSKLDTLISLENYIDQHQDTNILNSTISKIKSIPRTWISKLNREDEELALSRQKAIENKLGDSPKKQAQQILEETKAISRPDLYDEEIIVQGIIDRQEQLTILNLTSREKSVASKLTSRINLETKGRFIQLSVDMPEPVLATEFNIAVFKRLIQESIRLQTEKEVEDLKLTQEKFNFAEKNFFDIQVRLASFRDNNKGNRSAMANAEGMRLESDYEIAFVTYKSLASELEQKKLRLEEKVPLYKEYEPVSIPLAPSSASPIGIIFKHTILGIGYGLFIVVLMIVRELLLVYTSKVKFRNND